MPLTLTHVQFDFPTRVFTHFPIFLINSSLIHAKIQSLCPSSILAFFLFLTPAARVLFLPFCIISVFFISVFSTRLRALFFAVVIPPSSELFAVLNPKLSATLLCYLFVFPFTLSFLLLAKACTVRVLETNRQLQSSIPILMTQLCNSLLLLAVNVTCLSILVLSFSIMKVLGVSSAGTQLLISGLGAVIYSAVLANACIICNLSLIICWIEKHHSVFNSILKACVVIHGRADTAISLAVPLNMGLAAVEALFQFRVVGSSLQQEPNFSVRFFDGTFIAYLYAMLIAYLPARHYQEYAYNLFMYQKGNALIVVDESIQSYKE